MLRGVNGPATVVLASTSGRPAPRRSPSTADGRGRTVVLGVDIGTTSAKAVAFDADARELGRGETAYPLLEPEHGQAVQDPAVVVDGTLAAIRAAAAGARDRGARIAALSFSGAMHSLVGLDAGGGALTPLVTWGDMRATEQAERLRAEHPELHDRTGTPLHPMSPLPKLLWFAEHEPETFAATRRWAGIKELVLARLTGAWAVDHSIASGTGLLNLRELDWDREALAIAGIDADSLSPLVPTTHRLELGAAAAADLGLDAGPAVIVGAGDGPLANLGLGAVRPGVAACSIGTSGALRLMVERPAVDPQRRVFCYALVPGRWIVGGAINNGGAVLRWAGEALAPDLGPHAEAQLLELAAKVPAAQRGAAHAPLPALRARPALELGGARRLRRAHPPPRSRTPRARGARGRLPAARARARLDARRGQRGRARSAPRAASRAATSGARCWPTRWACRSASPPAARGRPSAPRCWRWRPSGSCTSIDRAADLVSIEDVVEPEAGAAAVYADLLPTFASLYDALAPAFRALERHR